MMFSHFKKFIQGRRRRRRRRSFFPISSQLGSIGRTFRSKYTSKALSGHTYPVIFKFLSYTQRNIWRMISCALNYKKQTKEVIIYHRYTVLKRCLKMRLKTVDSSNRTKFFWKEFHCERGRCYLMKALSPNVIFNQTAGVENKILKI